MSEKTASPYEREVRETIVKSSLTGVAATMMAVTIFSPAGFGGMIGTSLASGLGLDPNQAASDDIYARLPAFPSPLTPRELSEIQGKLSATAASLEITRAATEARIERVRTLANADGLIEFTTMPAPVTPMLAPAPAQPIVASATPVEEVVAAEPVEIAQLSPEAEAYRDRHLELASLMLGNEGGS